MKLNLKKKKKKKLEHHSNKFRPFTVSYTHNNPQNKNNNTL